MLETTFSPLLFGKSFMKIRSAIPENGCLVFFDGQKKKQKKRQKKNRKKICKTLRKSQSLSVITNSLITLVDCESVSAVINRMHCTDSANLAENLTRSGFT